MRYIILLAVVALVILLFSVDNEKISKKNKFIILIFFVVVGVFGYFLEKYQDDKFNNLDNLSKAFTQGKTLVCKGYDVNLTNFNLSYQTQTFIAKKDAQNKFKNIIVEIEDCKIKDE